ncbi:putative ribosome biogenesis protein BRX1 [Helianthus annuus]|nr:putative ribosome biogenesis protein BRX1 [Helianthus annuus]
MGKKRKHSDVEVPAVKKDETAPERPKRTLLGWKDKPETQQESTGFRNREKVLVTCSRRINYRYRHLMLNLVSVLPHCKKDNKVESKATKGATLNELVELKSCSSCLFFECRKHKDLYLWMSKCPNGPSVKFLVNAVHTMEELKLTGNHLKGSRPLLTFSSNFDKDPHWKLLKEMITQVRSCVFFVLRSWYNLGLKKRALSALKRKATLGAKSCALCDIRRALYKKRTKSELFSKKKFH